jgi:uncharacterized protein YfaS (alpha-2-macroglobulin family)
MRTSKRVLVVGGTVAALTTAGVAFAAWTSTGTGAGTATATTAKNLTVTAGAPSGLYPTGSVTMPVTVTNTNPYKVQLDTIDFVEATSSVPGCSASAISSTDGSYTDVVIAAGGSVTRDLTVSMSNAAEDACQGAAFTVRYLATARSAA